jgi:hypothetical protein
MLGMRPCQGHESVLAPGMAAILLEARDIHIGSATLIMFCLTDSIGLSYNDDQRFDGKGF